MLEAVTFLSDIHTIKYIKNNGRIIIMQRPQRPFMNDMMGNFPIAMAYVPMQQAPILYENLEEAFNRGTIFPELDKPFMGRRGRR
jgi:hypothetical protein